jgi:hypothetical protein
MAFYEETKVNKTAKQHMCQYCGVQIKAGLAAVKVAGLSDGDFYHGYGHADCVAMWHKAYAEFADPYDGMGWDLAGVLSQDEGREALMLELSGWSGAFPDVVARIAGRYQKSDAG